MGTRVKERTKLQTQTANKRGKLQRGVQCREETEVRRRRKRERMRVTTHHPGHMKVFIGMVEVQSSEREENESL